MRRRLLLGPLLIAALAGFWALDTRVLDRPLASRLLLWMLAAGAFHEFAAIVRRRVEAAPGFAAYGIAAIAAVVAPFLVTGVAVPGLLIVLAALLGGGIRFLGLAPSRTAAGALPEAALLAGGILYTAGLLHFLDRILVDSVSRAFAIVAISKTSDILGFLVGSTLGRKRIAPAVSPKKTWEGSIAGILGSGGVAALLAPVLSLPAPLSLSIGLAVGAASLFGDLLESGLKRWAGVKDSGALIPEFGGFLDLLDGILLAAPVAVFCLYGS